MLERVVNTVSHELGLAAGQLLSSAVCSYMLATKMYPPLTAVVVADNWVIPAAVHIGRELAPFEPGLVLTVKVTTGAPIVSKHDEYPFLDYLLTPVLERLQGNSLFAVPLSEGRRRDLELLGDVIAAKDGYSMTLSPEGLGLVVTPVGNDLSENIER